MGSVTISVEQFTVQGEHFRPVDVNRLGKVRMLEVHPSVHDRNQNAETIVFGDRGYPDRVANPVHGGGCLAADGLALRALPDTQFPVELDRGDTLSERELSQAAWSQIRRYRADRLDSPSNTAAELTNSEAYGLHFRHGATHDDGDRRRGDGISGFEEALERPIDPSHAVSDHLVSVGNGSEGEASEQYAGASLVGSLIWAHGVPPPWIFSTPPPHAGGPRPPGLRVSPAPPLSPDT